MGTLLGCQPIRMRATSDLCRQFLAVLCACLSLGHATFASDSVEIPVGGIIREATLVGLNGPSRKLSAYRGRPLIINVWASWCGPCRQEMASLERLAWRNSSARFAIIGISTDDDAEKAKGLLVSSHATISHFIDTRLVMENMLGAKQLPLTLLIDADGRVLKKIYGARQWDSEDALRLIDSAFTGSRRAPKQSRNEPYKEDRSQTAQYAMTERPFLIDDPFTTSPTLFNRGLSCRHAAGL